MEVDSIMEEKRISQQTKTVGISHQHISLVSMYLVEWVCPKKVVIRENFPRDFGIPDSWNPYRYRNWPMFSPGVSKKFVLMVNISSATARYPDIGFEMVVS